MKKKMIPLLLLISGVYTLSGCSKSDNNNNNTSSADQTFMKMASYSNFNEVDAGNMAASMGNDAMVKSFGSTMVSDHSTSESDLNTLALQKNVTLPTGPDSAHVAMKAQLMAMSGRAFDSAYIHVQIMDHQTVITMFQNEINNGSNADVKNYASKYLPKIQMHKTMADSIASAMHF